MLSCYCSDNVEFSAQPGASIAPSETWVAVQVSINEVVSNTRWLLVQEKTGTEAKIMYSAIISKDVKVALDDKTLTIILCQPRRTPREPNEYKLRFGNSFDFWQCLSEYFVARQKRAGSATMNSNITGQGAMLGTAGTLAGAAEPVLPMPLVQQGGHAGPVGQGGAIPAGLSGPMLAQDLYAALGLMSGQ